MFTDSVEMTDNYAVWWSYVPHFLHVPGYVYAYAFGELLVLALFARYRQEGRFSLRVIWTCCAPAAPTGRKRPSRRWASI